MAKKKVKLQVPVVELREYITWATTHLIDPKNAYELLHFQVLLEIHEKLWDYNNEKKGVVTLNPIELTAMRILMYRWDFFAAPAHLVPALAMVHNTLPKLALPDKTVLLPPPQTEQLYEDDE